MVFLLKKYISKLLLGKAMLAYCEGTEELRKEDGNEYRKTN